jgi:hypothetical protein
MILTLGDFLVEDWIRKPDRGERVIMHAVMGVGCGALLAFLVYAPSARRRDCAEVNGLGTRIVGLSRGGDWFRHGLAVDKTGQGTGRIGNCDAR